MNLSKVESSGIGIVHLGVGAFFRAFVLPQLQEMAQNFSANDFSGWGILGVSFRSAGVRNRLAKNNFCYHAVQISGSGYEIVEINTLSTVYFLQEQRAKVMQALISPELKMVTLTVSEKGYHYSANTQSINWNNLQIQKDLACPSMPNSVPGLLTLALKNRREMGLPPFACVSCDNLVANGRVLRKVVLDLARRIDPDLANWIDENTPFPCTMVDRIVPATKPEEVRKISKLTVWKDPAPVFHEPFRQWIIEDCFGSLSRPPLESVGVIFTKDVKPYEEMKLRLLNATHSAIAYLGQLLNKNTVFEAVQDPEIVDFIEYLWELELCPSLEESPDINLGKYTQRLMARYQNPALEHETIQIAMDGSQKIQPRILAPIRSNLLAGRPTSGLSLVVAAWIKFLVEKDANGRMQEIDDPLQESLLKAIRQKNPVDSILDISEIFGKDLRQDERFVKSVSETFVSMSQFGLRTCLKRFLEDSGSH